MKIAILGAIEIEIKPLLEKLDNYQTVEYANNTYYLSSYNGYDLIIAYSKIGKVFSAMTATVMLEKFGAEKLIFTGVAGGIADDIRVGDLVAANSTVQHDVDITAFGYQKGFVPGSELKIPTSQNLLASLQKVCADKNISLKTGTIATGDQFVHSAEYKDFIKSEFDAVAIEMEGASVNLVCNEMSVDSLIIRSISDTADGSAVDNFDEFANSSAIKSANLVLDLLSKDLV